MRKNAGLLGIDPNRLIASGSSAGGHLAACMIIEDSAAAVVDRMRGDGMLIRRLYRILNRQFHGFALQKISLQIAPYFLL